MSAVSTNGRLPLIRNYSPDADLLWLDGSRITQAQLLAEAQALASKFPPSAYLINYCDSRYAFIVGFVAALLSHRTSLLPPNRVPATIEDLRRRYPQSVTLADADTGIAEALMVPRQPSGATWTGEVPLIDEDHQAAIVFTSGSTGQPQAHPKSWRSLVLTAGYAAARLYTAGRCIIGTVPPQHMYGLETTVMPALAGGAMVCCERPLFPEDLRRLLAALPAPRMLITTPVHLHAFVQADLPRGEIERVVSATAPLSKTLCQEAEDSLGTRVEEIYGCTEAGSIATRHTRDSELWTPYPEARIRDCDDGAQVEGPHLLAPVQLSDVVQIEADGRFRLLGRPTDMVKVAGKRASLQDLTATLLELPGVLDAVIFIPHPDAEIARPAALVVAPERSETELLAALAQKVDPAFLPRPLRKVDRLPRNEVGKLPRSSLLSVLNG